MNESSAALHRRALLLLLLAAILWSLGGVLIKSIDLPPLAIAGCRSAIAAVVLAIAAGRLRFSWSRAQLAAAACFAATVLLFVVSTKLTTAANAILLQYTAPVYVAILSGPLLGEKIGRVDWAMLGVVALGMAVFFLEKVSPEHMLGDALALASGLSFAGIALCLRMQKGESTLESLFLGHCVTAAIGLPFLIGAATPSGRDVGLLLILGVVQLGIPYVLYGRAIQRVTALEATLIPVIEPILNPVWVAIFAAEAPSAYAMAGGAIVVGGVLGHSVIRLRRQTLAAAALPPAGD